MKIYYNLSIKTKLLLIITIVTAITIGIGFTITIFYDNYLYKNEMIENTKVDAQLFGEYCIAPLTFRDHKVAESVLEKITKIPAITSVCLYDEQNNLFISYHKTTKKEIPNSIPDEEKGLLTNEYYEFFYPIVYQDTKLGTIYLKASTEFMNAKIMKHLFIILVLMLILILLSYIIALKLQSGISKPIIELTKTTEIITQKEDYLIRVEKKGYDEIGKLYDSFNKMISQINLRKNERDNAEELLRKSEAEVKVLNQKLEERVKYRTSQLLAANKELEAFAYSVSHDLRAPLRSIDGFSQILLDEHKDKLNAQGKDFLNRVRNGAQKMSQLIDDILKLSKVTRSEMSIQKINLSSIANEIASSFQNSDPERKVKFTIHDSIVANVDKQLMQIVLENLIGNAWKFTSKLSAALIEFGVYQKEEKNIYYVSDNGAGFNMKYSNKLFGAFQRLHDSKEFDGTGIGLATVQRIIHRHGGKVWAKGEVGKGATFYFTLA